VKLTTHLQLVSKSRERRSSTVHFPIQLHGVVLNWFSREITLPFAFIIFSTTANFRYSLHARDKNKKLSADWSEMSRTEHQLD
jgi:hypothetical protein